MELDTDGSDSLQRIPNSYDPRNRTVSLILLLPSPNWLNNFPYFFLLTDSKEFIFEKSESDYCESII